MTEPLKVGQKVKNFEVTITNGTRTKLAEISASDGLVLYFYPKDNTPGCTTQACDFRDSSGQLKKLGYNVVGVSGDSPLSHQGFTQKQSLNFPLIADDDRQLALAFGVYGAKNLYGKIVQGLIRTTFVLDPDLKVIKVYKNVKAKGHVDRLLADLREH